MNATKKQGRYVPRFRFSIHPVTSERRQFPEITATFFRRNIRKTLALTHEHHVVFITRRGEDFAVLLSRDTVMDWSLMMLRRLTAPGAEPDPGTLGNRVSATLRLRRKRDPRAS